MALVATPDQAGGFVQLDATGLGVITQANLYRIDSAGNEALVRNGDPIAVAGGIFGTQDYEAPLDELLTWEVRNTGTGAVITSTTGTLPSVTDRAWLGSPGKPSLNVTVLPARFVPKTRRARSATFDVIGRTRPVGQSLRRGGDQGDLIVRFNTHAAYEAVQALLDDGSALLLRGPATWPTMGARYIQIGDIEYEPVTRVLTDERSTLSLPWVEVDRPAGLAQAGLGFRWADVIATYPTWADVMAANPTWADVIDGVP